VAESICPECKKERHDFSKVCPQCGAPPITEHRLEKVSERPVRTEDLEPYIALRYIARLFKVLATLIIIMSIGEVVTGLVMHGRAAIPDLVGEVTRLLVIGGLMWAGGDITLLAIDMGHDIRVSRILLGRINAELHRPKTENTTTTVSAPTQSGERRASV
jgi:hypothetical protein